MEWAKKIDLFLHCLKNYKSYLFVWLNFIFEVQFMLKFEFTYLFFLFSSDFIC